MNGLHVVIKGVLFQHGIDWFKDISGCVVVKHQFGLVQKERPHYHIWLPDTYDVVSTKKSLREYYDTKEKDLKWNTFANSYYTVKEHDNFDKWWAYTYKENCKEPDLVLWNASSERPITTPSNLVVLHGPSDEFFEPVTEALSVSKPVAPKPRKKEPTKIEAFFNYCEKYYKDNPSESISRHDVLELLLSWSKGGMNKFRVYEFVQYATFRLLSEGGEKTHQAFLDFKSRTLDEWSRMF